MSRARASLCACALFNSLLAVKSDDPVIIVLIAALASMSLFGALAP